MDASQKLEARITGDDVVLRGKSVVASSIIVGDVQSVTWERVVQHVDLETQDGSSRRVQNKELGTRVKEGTLRESGTEVGLMSERS